MSRREKSKADAVFGTPSQAEGRKRYTLLASNLDLLPGRAAFGRGTAFGVEPDLKTSMQMCQQRGRLIFSLRLQKRTVTSLFPDCFSYCAPSMGAPHPAKGEISKWLSIEEIRSGSKSSFPDTFFLEKQGICRTIPGISL